MYVPLQYIRLAPLSVRWYSACNVHIILYFCCVYMYSVHFLLLIPYTVIFLFVCFSPVWTKAPSALFLKGILPVSDCMCLMHFGS